MSARQYLSIWISVFLALLAIAGLVNYAIDPLQIFRRATFYPPHFSENQRYQVPGLARHYTAPVAIIGTSHMENASPADVQAALGQPALKLAISGSSITEQQLALSLALKTGKVRRVLWGIDYSALSWGDRLVEEWGEFPIYLYHRDPRLVSRYLLSWQTLQEGRAALTTPPKYNLETLNIWWPGAQFHRDRVAAAWAFQEGRWTPELRARSAAQTIWSKHYATLQRRLFATVREHPEVQFELLLPPYSILGYANDFRINDEWFFQRMLMRAALRDFVRTAPNARLWDFQTDLALSTDFDRYKDLEHFDLEATRMMLRTVGSGRGAVTDFSAPDPLPRQLADFLRPHCESRGNAAYCTPYIRCGYDRLEAWLESGANPERALAYAHRACRG